MARRLAAAAAAATAVLYALIGVGVLVVTNEGPSTDLQVFGLTAAAAFVAVAVVVTRARRRLVLAIVGALVVPVLIMYAVMAEVREPHVELWGLLIVALQVVLVGALVVAVVVPVSAGRSTATPTRPASAAR